MSMCLYRVCVCIFRVTERVGGCNREATFACCITSLSSGDKRKNKKDVSHLWHIYLDRTLTQSHSLPRWYILIRGLWDTKRCPQSTTVIGMNGIKTRPITAVQPWQYFPSVWELIPTFLWIESEERQKRFILLSAVSSVPWILMNETSMLECCMWSVNV